MCKAWKIHPIMSLWFLNTDLVLDLQPEAVTGLISGWLFISGPSWNLQPSANETLLADGILFLLESIL
jgi:hypothetical protein